MVIRQQQWRRGKLPAEVLRSQHEEREVHVTGGHSAALLGRHLLCLTAAGGGEGWTIGGCQEKVCCISYKLCG